MLDEGSNVNCIDQKVTNQRRIKFKKSKLAAQAPRSGSVTVSGICSSDLVISTVFGDKEVLINPGQPLVIPNLGVDILVGEPGKQSNNLSTDPSAKLLSCMYQGQVLSKPYLSSAVLVLCRLQSLQHLQDQGGQLRQPR